MKKLCFGVTLSLLSATSYAEVTCSDFISSVYAKDIPKASQLMLQSTAEISDESVGQKYFTKIYSMSSSEASKALPKLTEYCLKREQEYKLSDAIENTL